MDRHLPLRRCLLSCGLLVILIASGTTFGWTALEVALKRQGVYPHLTPAERNAKLQAVMTIAGVALGVGGILFGLLLDFAGPAVTNAASGLLFAAGCVTFGYNISYEAGYDAIAAAGAGVLAAGFRLGGVFPMYTAYIMTAVTCCFDSSTIVFLIYDTLNLKVGLSQKVFFSCLAGVVLCLQCGMACMWSVYLKHKPVIDEAEEREAAAEEEKLLLIAEEMEKALGEEGLVPSENAPLLPQPVIADAAMPSLLDPNRRKSSLLHKLIRNGSLGKVSVADEGGSVRSSSSRISIASALTAIRRRRRRSTLTMMEEVLAMDPQERAKNIPLADDDTVPRVFVPQATDPSSRRRSAPVAYVHTPIDNRRSSAPVVSPSMMARLRLGHRPSLGALSGAPSLNAGYGATLSDDVGGGMVTPFGLTVFAEDRRHDSRGLSVASDTRSEHAPEADDAASSSSSSSGSAHGDAFGPQPTGTVQDGTPVSYIPLLERSYKEQVLSIEFAFVLSMTCISLYRIGWYISSTQPFLESLGDKDNTYAQLVALILPFEALIVPVTVLIIQRYGLWVGALCAVGVGCLQCVIEVIPVLQLQLLATVTVVAFRSLSQSVINTFTVRVFGTRNVGRHAGLLRAVAGLLALTQIPLMGFVQRGLHGDFINVHIGACFVIVLLAALVIALRFVSKEAVIFTGRR